MIRRAWFVAFGLPLTACTREEPPGHRGAGLKDSPVDRDPVTRLYSQAFLNALAALSAAPGAPGAESPEGHREVTVPSRHGRYQVTLDGSAQVLALDIPEDTEYTEEAGRRPAALYPSVAAAGAGPFVPAALLGLKAKQFDDGLYARVALAADAGAGKLPGRAALLEALLARLLEKNPPPGAAALLAAARRLRGREPALPGPVAALAAAIEQGFLAEPLRSRPLGFYTWSEELAGIFRCDRLLQEELDEPGARSLAEALAADPPASSAYRAALELAERLTGPLAAPDLREAAASLLRSEALRIPPRAALFPASRAHETELVKKLFADRPIPEGFDLAAELIQGIRDGTVELEPGPRSGWYDYQTWSLEPLVVPERMPEAARLELSASYREELSGLFRALLALTRETHVKQLEVPSVGAALPPDLEIAPGLTVEPLASYYLRRALSYAFVRGLLEDAFGKDALAAMQRLTAAGPVNMPLGDELALLEDLFHGAYLAARESLGLAPEQAVQLGPPARARSAFAAWCRSLAADPDLGQDVRMMVPVFHDLQRRRTKVWAVLGLAVRPLEVGFARPPRVVRVRAEDGTPVDVENLRIAFRGERHGLVYLAAVELYVEEVLGRREFRELCDRCGSYESIVEALR